MLWTSLASAVFLSLGTTVSAHYTFPSLILGSSPSTDWQYVRKTDNYNSNNPITDVSSTNFRCYNGAVNAAASTVSAAAGSQIGFKASQSVFHPGVLNVYMAKAPGSAAGWDGSGQVWFKVYQIPGVVSGGAINFPAYNVDRFTFTIPRNLPSGEYLVRVEHIALHSASTFGGAQFYVSCAQINVTGGGSGKPGPLVAIPGVYTGREPGIMLNIYYPIPATYTQPGPTVWTG